LREWRERRVRRPDRSAAVALATVGSAGRHASEKNQPGLMQRAADFCNKIGHKRMRVRFLSKRGKSLSTRR
jgi:hypothetical protein